MNKARVESASSADRHTEPLRISPVGASRREVKGACPHDCPDTCALVTTVEAGRVTKLSGSKEHPSTAGVLCTKVARYAERTYSPDRLKTPLKRTGPKGSGQFAAISWDEALDSIAKRLQSVAARNPEGILPYNYAGTMGFVQGEFPQRFFHRLGASLLDKTICASAGSTALLYTLGASVGMDVERFIDSKLILIWGSNAIASNLHFWSIAQEAKRRGAKLIAIDPFKSDTALKCHEHIALKPGTDAAFALGLIRELKHQALIDQDYIDRYTLGSEALFERAQAFTLERTAELCGIDQSQIAALALDYGSIRPAAIRLNYGMQRVRGGGNAARLIAGLPALIGAWRDPAGGMLLSSSGHFPTNLAGLTRPDLVPQLKADPGRLPRTINMSAIGDALLHADPAIEAIIVYNANPLAVAPETAKVRQGFLREDLFTVVIEHFQTDTADYADIILPATTQLEHFDLHKSYGHRYLLVNEAAVEPLAEARSNARIFRDLAHRMGWDEACLFDDDVAVAQSAIDWADLRLAGVSLQALRQQGWHKLAINDAPFAEGNFPTPSGKVEFFSKRLADQGLDPLPDYLPPYESVETAPELASRFPLAMISPPARNFLNSSFVNVQSLRSIEGEQACVMHPDDARQRKLLEGDLVSVHNDRGAFQAILHISDRTRPGLVVGFGIWWHKLAVGGNNVNAVTHQRLTDLGRAASFYDCLVEVSPCEPMGEDNAAHKALSH
ncbi:MAG: molybdopterin oxidoreductase family protein [Betaproteobacteria bacterium]|nr:molybdopterin oxidoreductase family protein [Betaproteobacteria bacterium]NBY55027.1 molybdopterin oxidoreductase family protein [Betaproteobacteria bacterium]NCW81788.1 molybdopterin oxidoreductase family protein [Betaproteobacteria bacterium]NDA93197.1 molybdopterin oxidoreductase family protein [Betaproteobacteria bacterium]NDE93397.1 molybdopterin oxidoreductase family protein [Betaproteobacteria bacterium]